MLGSISSAASPARDIWCRTIQRTINQAVHPLRKRRPNIRRALEMVTSPAHSKIFILDFGSQYTQVIARRVRELQVYSEIVRFDIAAAEIAKLKANGIILSGGPA